jgi:hypothetical protein
VAIDFIDDDQGDNRDTDTLLGVVADKNVEVLDAHNEREDNREDLDALHSGHLFDWYVRVAISWLLLDALQHALAWCDPPFALYLVTVYVV